MKSYVASGFSLYASLTVYGNFMNLGADDIFSAPIGSVKGGHAVNLPGYGTKSGTKYWLIQNSWGAHSWGDQGYGKIMRGTNLCGIETDAFAVRAWVEGGTVPPCTDSNDGTGLSSTGAKPYIPCSQAKTGPYGNLCSSHATARKRCPLTCGGCAGTNGAGTSVAPAPAPGPTSAPTPAPTPAPDATPAPTPVPPAGCADWSDTQIKLNGVSATCQRLAAYCNEFPVVMTRCQATCGACPSPDGDGNGGDGGPSPSPGPNGQKDGDVCEDDASYRDPQYGDSCSGWVGYECSSKNIAAQHVAGLREHCPQACNLCQ